MHKREFGPIKWPLHRINDKCRVEQQTKAGAEWKRVHIPRDGQLYQFYKMKAKQLGCTKTRDPFSVTTGSGNKKYEIKLVLGPRCGIRRSDIDGKQYGIALRSLPKETRKTVKKKIKKCKKSKVKKAKKKSK